MFEDLDDAAVVAGMADDARAENIRCAHRMASIAELYERRQIPVEDGLGRELWRIDPWDSVAAEISAALEISKYAASALIHIATCLAERLPKLAAVFATGTISYATVKTVVSRTMLALEPAVLDAIDTEIAELVAGWGPLSHNKTEQAIDAVVTRHDPQARHRTETAARARYLDVETNPNGTATVTGQLYGTDGTLLDRQLTALAHTVCDGDPRTMDQRRADAMGALAAKLDTLACACGLDTCLADAQTAGSPAVIVHAVVDRDSMADNGKAVQALHGTQPGDHTREILTQERFAEVMADYFGNNRADHPQQPPPSTTLTTPRSGVVLGGPIVPATMLADLIARGLAKVQPVVHPGDSPPEDRYLASKALADFVRCRDMTCRFPHCDHPADRCDLDHTIPYGRGGPTHASNIKCLCRFHHLLKTFWTGSTGWCDTQYPDGTVEWRAPTGHTYRTDPGSKLLVPALCVPTGTLHVTPRPESGQNRGAMMPQRKETRAKSQLRRILALRAANMPPLRT